MEEAELRRYYGKGVERNRLGQDRGLLEFARTTEIVLRYLPRPPAVVADIGGGPGRYALWLAGLGYRVEHRDLLPLHVRQLRDDAGSIDGVHTAVGDARDLDLGDASVDAVLLLGPLYHLRERDKRIRALTEARRIVRPGGPVFAAAISRWVPRILGELREKLYLSNPHVRELTPHAERTGRLPAVTPGSFAGYCHRPRQLRAELRDAGLEVADLVSVDGPAFLVPDLAARWDDPADRAVILDAARAFERVPELLGLGPHLLATAIRPRLSKLTRARKRRVPPPLTRRNGAQPCGRSLGFIPSPSPSASASVSSSESSSSSGASSVALISSISSSANATFPMMILSGFPGPPVPGWLDAGQPRSIVSSATVRLTPIRALDTS
jgi:SAM-dependent methyltransferase